MVYVELPVRRCFPEAFFGRSIPDVVREQARFELLAGIAVLKRCGLFVPYVAGRQFTLADILFLYSLQPALAVGRRVHGLDLLAGFDSGKELMELLADRPHERAIAARREMARTEYLSRMTSRAETRGGPAKDD